MTKGILAMATIVLGDNPGPVRVDVGQTDVTVTLRDGEGATIIASYTDLETIAETIHLLIEARETLTELQVARNGRTAHIRSVTAGDRIVVDGRIVEATNVVIHADTIGIAYTDPGQPLAAGSYREYHSDDHVVRVSPPTLVVL
jgi:hypothetical protein